MAEGLANSRAGGETSDKSPVSKSHSPSASPPLARLRRPNSSRAAAPVNRTKLLDPRWQVAPSAVLAWVIVQIACLAIGLLQLPLAAYRAPGSTLMPEILLAGQIGFAALLAPLLLRSPATLLVITLSSWPPLLLACGLATRPAASIALAGVVVSGWLVLLFFWITSFRTPAVRQLVSAMA